MTLNIEAQPNIKPQPGTHRIASLDVLRGFALLGILLLNILGFGLMSASYSNPGFDVSVTDTSVLLTWASVELFAEGAMRCLFSILFGAGVILFTTGRSGILHYKRTFWLLLFGLFDAYILLWNGDILVTYAIAGAILYWFRNLSSRTLLIVAGLLILLMSLQHLGLKVIMEYAYSAHQQVLSSQDPAQLTADTRQLADSWKDMSKDLTPSPDVLLSELSQRTDTYLTAFQWNMDKVNGMLFFVLPAFLIWDALAMMLLGMAFYKSGLLQGERSSAFYIKLMLFGFTTGLFVNGYEVSQSIVSEFDLFNVLAQMQFTYHIGRLGMAMGYIGLILWLLRLNVLAQLRNGFAAIGRMALTNYLMQSLICLFVFTGAGLGLLDQLNRAQLYPLVFAIWIFQMLFSSWWLKRYKFGPIEWLWRALTYGTRPDFRL